MMANNRNKYYTRSRQSHIAEYSEAILTYRENNCVEINSCPRNARRRNKHKLHNESECLGEILSDDIPPLSISILSEECIN